MEHFDEECICIQCNDSMEHFHLRFDCNPFKTYPDFNVFQETKFNDRNFECKYTAKTQKNIEMTKNNNLRDKIKDFKCDQCMFCTAYKYNLYRRIKTKHKIVV